MNTETRRIASARLHAERKAAGWRKVTLWLTPEAAFKLDALKAAAGSTDEAVRQAILAWSGPGLSERVTAKLRDTKPATAKHATVEIEGYGAIHGITSSPAEGRVQIGPQRPKPGSRLKGAKK